MSEATAISKGIANVKDIAEKKRMHSRYEEIRNILNDDKPSTTSIPNAASTDEEIAKASKLSSKPIFTISSLGALLMLIGAIGVCRYWLFFDVSIQSGIEPGFGIVGNERVVNLGLIGDRLAGIVASSALELTGAVFVAAGALLGEKWEKMRTASYFRELNDRRVAE